MISRDTKSAIKMGIHQLLGTGNYDVNEPRLGDTAKYPDYQLVPHTIYLIYVGFTPHGRPDVKHYLHQEPRAIPYNQVPSHIEIIAENARNNNLGQEVTSGSPGLQPFGLHDIEWKYKSYIALIVDSKYWTLIHSAQNAAIVFNTDKGSAPNHTFFDAKPVDIQLPRIATDPNDDGMRSAIYFVNHLKKSDFGDDLGVRQDGSHMLESERFIFDIYFAVLGVDGHASVVIVDPDGTNDGPPIGPPP